MSTSTLSQLEMKQSELRLADGAVHATDEKGYLLDFSLWTPAVAEYMAAADGLQLDSDHWVIFEIFRDYFSHYDIEPPMRVLVKRAQQSLGDSKGNSRFLYQLFPDGPGTQACRYSGLPRPLSCI